MKIFRPLFTYLCVNRLSDFRTMKKLSQSPVVDSCCRMHDEAMGLLF